MISAENENLDFVRSDRSLHDHYQIPNTMIEYDEDIEYDSEIHNQRILPPFYRRVYSQGQLFFFIIKFYLYRNRTSGTNIECNCKRKCYVAL